MASLLATSGQNLLNNNRYDVMKQSIKVNTDIENLIKAEVFRKQIRIREFFFDYDRLRKGTVTQDKFRSALAMLHMHITEKDILELIKRYQVGVDLVDYVSFCKQVDEQFFDYNIAKSNLATTKSSSSLSQQEQIAIRNILSQIKEQISQKRIMLKQPFQDFDRTRCSHITVDQFSRVLQNLHLLPPERYFNLLIRNYIDNGNPKEVNYVLFCDDVDNVSEMLETVIKGIKPNEKPLNMNEDIIDDPNKVALSQTLFKRLSHKPENLQKVEEKIQAETVMKRIRIREFFRDFDSLRQGTISQTQFRRVLHITNINLSEEEIKILLDEYKVEKRFNGDVRYSDFCEAIDRVFTTQGIEKDPLYQVNQISSETTVPARQTFIGMSQGEQEKLNLLLELYRKEIANKRILLKPHFQDFDITKAGHISKGQFLRIINQFGLFPQPEALNLILKRYMDQGTLDEVNYYEFCRDVDIFSQGAQISKAYAEQFKTLVKTDHETNTFIYNDSPNDLEDLMAKIRRKVSEFRLRIAEFLRDFDKLRTGTITSKQLRLGLNMAQVPLSDQQFNLILDYFSCPNKQGFVYWRKFCDAVDQVFSLKNLEKTQGTAFPIPVSTVFQYGKKPLTQAEINLAEELKHRFSFFCKATRLDIKQFFKDWDKQARNKVTPKQFRQVFATINFPMNQEEFQALVRMYFCEEEKDVRYVDFIRDTNVYEAMLVSNSQIKNEGINTALAGTRRSYDVDVLLDDIKNFIKINRLRVGEYFKDFDTLRKGTIAENQFAGVISQMKIDLDDKQIDLLKLRYLLPHDPSQVNYDKFLAEVNVVFTVPELEKDPITKPPVFEKGTFIDPRDVLTGQEQHDLHQLLLRLGEVVRKHRIIFKTHFQDQDIAQSGKVSFTRFRSILDIHQIPLDESQFQLLCQRFAHQGVEFNYVEFDEVLKQYENSD